jgi:hypothetical protein
MFLRQNVCIFFSYFILDFAFGGLKVKHLPFLGGNNGRHQMVQKWDEKNGSRLSRMMNSQVQNSC